MCPAVSHWQDNRLHKIDSVWAAAHERSTTPLFNRKFHTVQRNEGAGCMGALGECCVEYWLDWHGVDWLPDGNINNDLLVLGKRAEIKTKLRTSIPQGVFEASVNNYGDWIQKPDLFIFVSLYRDQGCDTTSVDSFGAAFLVGWCWDEELYEYGYQKNIGDKDESNGMVARATSMNIEHRFLRDINTIGEWV